MAKIICPNKQYTGYSVGVRFVNGIGETDNKYAVEWFEGHGYKVEYDGNRIYFPPGTCLCCDPGPKGEPGIMPDGELPKTDGEPPKTDDEPPISDTPPKTDDEPPTTDGETGKKKKG